MFSSNGWQMMDFPKGKNWEFLIHHDEASVREIPNFKIFMENLNWKSLTLRRYIRLLFLAEFYQPWTFFMEGNEDSEAHTYERIYVNGYHGNPKQHSCSEDNPTCQVISLSSSVTFLSLSQCHVLESVPCVLNCLLLCITIHRLPSTPCLISP